MPIPPPPQHASPLPCPHPTRLGLAQAAFRESVLDKQYSGKSWVSLQAINVAEADD